MRSWAYLVVLVLWSTAAFSATVTDATGRAVQVPDHIRHVIPAGPPAAVLLEAIAPDLMQGWPEAEPEAALALMAPDVAKLPLVPRLTGREDVSEKIKALKPDLILDYGTVSPRYADLAKATQEKTGIPTLLLDGSLDKVPATARLLGQILDRRDRAETVGRFAEALLALPRPAAHPTVVYARGADGLTVAAPGTDVTAVFTTLGWTVRAPEGQGTFRSASIEAIKTLDPDMLVFGNPAMAETLKQSPAWQSVRAVQQGRAFVSPDVPFGWVEEPPSINRLLGLAWLSGSDPETLAALSDGLIFGHTVSRAELGTMLAHVRQVTP